MNQHNTPIVPVPVPVLEAVEVSLQDPRGRLAALAALALDRCPAELVARRTGRSQATVYGWRHEATVGGLRVLDLVLAPRPFGVMVARGLVASMGAPPSDGPSRSSLAAALARIAGLLLATEREDPSSLSDEQLRERLGALDDAAAQIAEQRARFEGEAVRRRVEAARAKGGAR
jgi:hypothetical protein